MSPLRRLETAMVAMALLWPLDVVAQPAHTRKSVSSLSAVELEQYRTVVSAMKALPVSNQRSWLYQAGIHQYIEPSAVQALPSNQFTAADKAEMLPFALTAPPHAQQHETWAQCHQSNPDRVFLLWHRVYLHHFERIARKVSGQSSFALPYWDYTKGTAVLPDPRRLPEGFRSPTYVPPGETDARPNPLFALREPLINAGNPLDVSIVSLDSLTEPSFDTFSGALENNPHNALHGAVGKDNSLLMGATVWAAQDPIFWLHHANIDRLWECWKRLGNPTDPSDEEGQYTFIDEDGNTVTHTIAEMEQIAATVDYQYEELNECPTPPPVVPEPRVPLAMRLTAFSTKPAAGVPLGATPKAVEVRIAPLARRVMRTRDFRARAHDFRVRLELNNIRADAPVGVLYEVRIRPAGGTAPGKTVGVVSFFGRDDRVLRSRAHRAHGREPSGFSLSFDVTEALFARDVFRTGVPEKLDVVLVPIAGVEGGRAVADSFNAGAQPRVEEIQLVVLGRSLPRPD